MEHGVSQGTCERNGRQPAVCPQGGAGSRAIAEGRVTTGLFAANLIL